LYKDKVASSNSSCEKTDCPGGFLLPILTIILFLATSNFDELTVILETYNGKSTGIVLRTNGKTTEKEEIHQALIYKGKKQASIMITEITGILSSFLKPHCTDVFLSVGLVVVGTIIMNGVEMKALVRYDIFNMCEKLKNLRKDVSDMFKKSDVCPKPDSSNNVDSDSDDDWNDSGEKQPILGTADSGDKNIRFANHILISCKNIMDLYNVGGFSLNPEQSITVKFKPNGNKFISLSLDNISKITRVQTYVPALRLKGTDIPIIMDIDNVLDVEAIRKVILNFQTGSQACISNLKDPDAMMGSRCEVTSKVENPKDGIMTSKLMKEGLLLLINDMQKILQTKIKGVCADTIIDKIDFGVKTVVGMGEALIEMVSTPFSGIQLSRSKQITEFEEQMQSVISVISKFWSGRQRHKYSKLYANFISVPAGRNLFSPFCYGAQEILKKILNGNYNRILKNLGLEKISDKLSKILEADQWFYDNPLMILNKKNASPDFVNNDPSSICMICKHVFNTSDKESDVIRLHPCSNLNCTDLVSIYSYRCQKYVVSQLESLNPDQRSILDTIMAKKNVILLAAAGCGKSHILKLINLIFRQRISKEAVILLAMYNNIANDLSGSTVNSFFKVGVLDPLKEGVHVYREVLDIEEFVKEKFSDSLGAKRILEIKHAEVLIIDEVIFFLEFSLLYSHNSSIEVFKLRIL
jgi:hypothetical protein